MGSSRKGGLWEVGRYVYPYPCRRSSTDLMLGDLGLRADRRCCLDVF